MVRDTMRSNCHAQRAALLRPALWPRRVLRRHGTKSDTTSAGPTARAGHGGLIFWPIQLSVLSMRRRFAMSSLGTVADHPSPPSSPWLSKKVRRAVAAMPDASARV